MLWKQWSCLEGVSKKSEKSCSAAGKSLSLCVRLMRVDCKDTQPADASFRSWALMGPGAVGLYYGGLLAASGERFHVLARSDAAVLEERGLTLSRVAPKSGEVLGETVVRPASVAREAGAIGRVDCVLIAAKATFNEALIDPLSELVEPGRTTILTLQNGMGNAEFYARHFPDNPVLSGLCFVCVNRVAPGVVANYHPGRVEIGSLGDRWPDLAQRAVERFARAGVQTVYAPSLDAALWRKLCWNVPFNGQAIAGGGITCENFFWRTPVCGSVPVRSWTRSARRPVGPGMGSRIAFWRGSLR